MTTENFGKKPGTTSNLKRLSKVDVSAKPVTGDLVEQVPAWLKQLLTKYGEREGRLTGLGESFSPMPERVRTGDEEGADLSALFEQMAETGVQTPQNRLATSVEWGGVDDAPEPPAAPLDDLLANLGQETGAYPPAYPAPSGIAAEVPDWLTAESAESYEANLGTASGSMEAPDWLNEAMALEPIIPSPAATPKPQVEDVPDWLDQALEKPVVAASQPPPVAAPSAQEAYDVPDWLEQNLTSPAPKPAEPSPAAPSTDLEIPDWLTETAAPPASPQPEVVEPTRLTSAEPTTADDVPDWLTDMVAPPMFADSDTGAGLPETEESIEVPDWLAEITPPTADKPAPTPSQTEVPAAPTNKYGTSWLNQEQPGLPSLDWLLQSQDLPPVTPDQPTAPGAGQPDWLFEPASSAEQEPPALPTFSTTPSQAETTNLSWLREIDATTSMEADEAPPPWLESLSPPTAADDGTPDWLQGLQSFHAEGAEAGDFADVSPSSTDMGWLSDLNLQPTEPGPPRSIPGVTGFLSSDDDLPASPEQPAAPPTTTGSESKLLSRYKRLRPSQAETPAESGMVTPSASPLASRLSETPGWGQTGPSESTPGAADSLAEAQDWLSSLSDQVAGSPDWLDELADATPEATPEAWVAEPAAEADDLLSARLDWLSNLDAELPPAPPTTATTPEAAVADVPAWLDDFEIEPPPATPSVEIVSAAVPTEAEAEFDWLADISTPTPAQEAEAPPAEPQPDALPWLNLPTDITAEPSGLSDLPTSTGFEVPSWLTDLPTEAEADATPAEEPEAEIELDAPPWLIQFSGQAEEPPGAAKDAGQTPVVWDVFDDEFDFEADASAESDERSLEEELQETPAWLTDLSPALNLPEATPSESSLPAQDTAFDFEAAVPTALTVGFERQPEGMPDWLADLRDDPTSSAASAELAADLSSEMPAWLSELPAETMDQVETEALPSWLSDLPVATSKAPAEATEDETSSWLAQLPESPGETADEPVQEIELELETPAWLTDLADEGLAPTQQPTWFADLAQTPSADTALPGSEFDLAAEETPPWLAELSPSPAEIPPPVVTSPETAELELPAWMAEVETTTVTTGLLVDNDELEADIPAWLTDLPAETPTAVAPALTTTEDEAEFEIPAWLTSPTEEAEVRVEEPPAWLAALPDTAEPTESPELEMPAWFSDLPAVADEPVLETPAELPVEEPPTWLAELSTETPVETEPTVAPPAPMTAPLVDVEPQLAVETSTEIPSWLMDLPQTDEAVLEKKTTWLPELSAEASTPAEETPAWLTELSSTPAEVEPVASAETPPTMELQLPAWLTDVQDETAADQMLPEPVLDTEDELETPSWLADLSAEAQPQPEATPAWLADQTEAADLVSAVPVVDQPEEVAEATPAWLTEAQSEAETEALSETPAWLAELQLKVGTPLEPMAAETDEPRSPAWLADLSTPADIEQPPAMTPKTTMILGDVEAEPEASSDIPASPWQTKFLGPTEAEETPSWLDELSTEATETGMASASEIEEEAPAWLADLGTTTPAEVEAEARPAWLAELGDDALSEEPVAVADEAEIPAWLADTPAAAPEEAGPAWLEQLSEPVAAEQTWPQAVEAAAETDMAIPAWLADIAETDLVEPDTLASTAEAEAEADIPAWLRELKPTSPVETPGELTPEALTSPDMELAPAWATPPEQTAEAMEQGTEGEAAGDTPSWLQELQAVQSDMAESPPAVEVSDTKLALPAWLADLDEATAEPLPARQTDETLLNVPSWLAELPQLEDEEDVAAPAMAHDMAEVEKPLPLEVQATGADEADEEIPAWLADLSTDELKRPSWLTGTPAAAEIEFPSETDLSQGEVQEIETAATADEEIPAWLADLSTEELKRPSWLTDTATAAETEVPPETDLTQGEVDEEVALPTEVAELAPELLPLAPLTEAEAEEELPAWLADLSTDELKKPSWLNDTVAPLPEGEAAEEIPAWLTDAAAADQEERDMPATWVEETSMAIESPSTLEATPSEEAAAQPVFIAEAMTEAELPQATDEPLIGMEVAEPEAEPELAETPAASLIGAELVKPEAEPELTDRPAEPLIGAELAEPELNFLDQDAPELPDWLLDEPKVAKTETPTLASFKPDVAESPDWLKELGDAPAEPLEADQTLSPAASEPGTTQAAVAASTPSDRMSDWLRGLKPAEESLEVEENKASEATGVMAGIAPLLPVEKMVATPPLLDPQATATTAQADAVLEAARSFYAIATQAPQPATLPEPITRGEQITGRIARAALYLLFMALLALPLLPNLQKVVDPATGRKVPWTEPAGSLAEVLDKQRRELVSAQLGAIDLQQPGSIALVSFDYSAATQGEMQPLAEAMLGRLRGQGLRLILVSLEPEGPALAQRTLDKILADRAETYGVEAVNLGYLPGQVLGIRELMAGRTQLSAIADFKDGLTLQSAERAGWAGVNNLGQVSIVITLSDNPTTARWWIEQKATAIPLAGGQRYLLAATSAIADPLVRPYVDTQQLDGLISGVNGAAAIEAGRQNFGPARQMLDSQGIAHLLIVILIALGTMAGWMPTTETKAKG